MIKTSLTSLILIFCAASWVVALEPAVDRQERVEVALCRLRQNTQSQTLEFPASRVEDARHFARQALDRVSTLIRSGTIDPRVAWTIALNPTALAAEIDHRPLLPSHFLDYVILLHLNEPGIEHPAALALRSSLMDLLWAHHFSRSGGEFQKTYLQKIRLLETGWPSRVDGDPRKRQKVQDALIWIERTGLEKDLMARVRGSFSHPNIRVTVKRGLINGIIPPIADFANSQHFTDLILGNSVHTTVSTKGKAHIDLVPNVTAIQLDVVAQSQSHAQSVALNSRATIYSRSTTEAFVRKPLLMSPTGLDANWAPTVKANVASTVDDVAVSGRFFRGIATRVAWNQVMSMKSSADVVAKRLTERRAADQLDQRLRPLIHDFNSNYRERVVHPPTRIGYWPRSLAFRSSQDGVEFTGIFAPEDELGSNQSFPPASGRHGIEVAIHESLVDNLSLALIGAMRNELKDEQFEQAMSLLTGRVPGALRVFTGSTRWAVTFPRHPVRVKFEHGQIRLSVRINGIRIEDVHTAADLSVCCNYLPTVTQFGPLFQRGGRVAGFGTGNDLSAEQIAFIRDKMNALFPETMRFDGLVLPIGGSLNRLAGLTLTEINCDGGVLILGYDD